MPDLRLSDARKLAIDQLPERKAPLFLSINKTAGLLIDEALSQRRALLKSGAKLPKKKSGQ